MSEYIEREAAIAHRREYNLGGSYDNTELAVPVDAINSTPSADVRPVIRGEWIDETGFIFADLSQQVRCSKCGLIAYFYDKMPMNFCPNCGADMGEE